MLWLPCKIALHDVMALPVIHLAHAHQLCSLLQALPAFVLITVFINIFFILTKGAKNLVSIESDKGAWISAIAGVGCAVIAAVIGFPLMRKKLAAMKEDVPGAKALQAGFETERTDGFQERVARALKVGGSWFPGAISGSSADHWLEQPCW